MNLNIEWCLYLTHSRYYLAWICGQRARRVLIAHNIHRKRRKRSRCWKRPRPLNRPIAAQSLREREVSGQLSWSGDCERCQSGCRSVEWTCTDAVRDRLRLPTSRTTPCQVAIDDSILIAFLFSYTLEIILKNTFLLYIYIFSILFIIGISLTIIIKIHNK